MPGTFTEKSPNTAAPLRHRGAYFQEDASTKGLGLVEAKHKDLKIYWLVDPENDRIYSAKFFAYGGRESTAIGECLSDMVEGKSISQATAITPEQVREQLTIQSGQQTVAGLFDKVLPSITSLLEAAQSAYPKAKAVVLACKKANAAHTPTGPQFCQLEVAEQAWLKLDKNSQLAKIEAVLDGKIRAALKMHGGEVRVIDLKESYKLTIEYLGACGGCASATGATLSYIEDTLQKEVFTKLEVRPVF